jgi:fatty-acyl-CoA synthase
MSLHDAHWPKRLPRAISLPETTLWDHLDISTRRFPDREALHFLGRGLTYREVHQAVDRLAAWLASQGVRKGDRVLLNMQNCPQLVMAHFAILRANAVVVPINPMNRAEELQHYVVDPDVKVAITTSDLAAELVKASNGLPPEQRLQHLLVTHYTDYLPNDPASAQTLPAAWQTWLYAHPEVPALTDGQVTDWPTALRCETPAPEYRCTMQDLAVLPYTSGTTGLPKGCMHPHRSIVHNAIASSMWSNGTYESVVLGVVPMFHITGMVVVMHTTIYLGAKLVLLPRWDREVAGHLISHMRVTSWTNIPTMIIDLLASPNFDKFDLSNLVYIGGGGAAMPQAIAQRLFDLYGLRYVEGYGLTETAAPSHSNPPDRPKQQCLGMPFVSTDARVIDPETLQPVAVGEQGEIVIHGPEVFDGYWKQPQATNNAFIEIDGKRFFRSGDLGHMDEEGYFFITDRLKRMINASGFKVWPAEVESLMYKHPAIQEVCIIATKDAYRGESVKALVVLRPQSKDQVTPQAIQDWCHEHMAAYKAPKSIEFLDTLPKSGSGKVLWRILQEREMAKPAA